MKKIFAVSIILCIISLSAYAAVKPRAPAESAPRFGGFGEIPESEAPGKIPAREFRRVVIIEDDNPAKTLPESGAAELPDGEIVPVDREVPDFSGNRREFVEFVGPWAVKLWKEHRILPSLTIAQAIIETGDGVYAIGWNLGGVKACCQSDEIVNEFAYTINGQVHTAGECVRHPGKLKSKLWTKENYGAGLVRTQQWFAYYKSMREFIDKRYAVLSQSAYYPGLIGESDYHKAAHKVKMYASSEPYPEAVIAMIESNNLTEWDPGGEKYNACSVW
jgi:flagellum-specific peptidoglycan hydrolase FlgJ